MEVALDVGDGVIDLQDVQEEENSESGGLTFGIQHWRL